MLTRWQHTRKVWDMNRTAFALTVLMVAIVLGRALAFVVSAA